MKIDYSDKVNQLAGTAAVQNKQKKSEEITPLGIYNRNRDERTFDALFWLRLEKENHYQALILKAYGNEDIQRIRNLKPFCDYAAQFSITAPLPIGQANVAEMMPPTKIRAKIEMRKQQVINSHPFVPLADAEYNLSDLNGMGNVDRTDLKVVQVYINSMATDEDVVILSAVDGTTTNALHALVDPLVFHNVGVSVSSFVYLLGTLERNESNQIQMSVCNILPIFKMPLQKPR
jgi:hypothetical protein